MRKLGFASGLLLVVLLLVILFAILPEVQAFAGDWLMFHGDMQHSGYSTSSGPDTSHELWNYTTGGSVASCPAVVDGRVYVGSGDDKTYCLNALTGASVWDFTANNSIVSSPAVVDGDVYVGSLDGKVYCLDSSTGALIWNFTSGNSIFSSPTVADNRVYIGSFDRTIYCLDTSTGAPIWSYTTGGPVTSSPAIADGSVYVGSFDANVYCLNATTGASIWNFTTGARFFASPALANGSVYVGSDDNRIYCLNALTGDLVWNFTTGGSIESSPAVGYGNVYFGSFDRNVYCLNALTGDLVWNFTTGNSVASSPALAEGNVYLGSFDTKVYCLNASTGGSIWSYATDGPIAGSPAVSYGNVYIGSEDSKIYAFGPVPPISILSPEEKTYSANTIPLTFITNRPTAWIGYSLDGETNVTILGNTSLTAISDGAHEVVIYANDTGGTMGLAGIIHFAVDTAPPNITSVSQTPPQNDVTPQDTVIINATVTDNLSKVKEVFLNYTTGNGTCANITMSNLEQNTWNASIPAFPYLTNVTYIIAAEDNANNTITTLTMGYTFQYQVIPEFPTLTMLLPLFMMSTLLAIAFRRRKQLKSA